MKAFAASDPRAPRRARIQASCEEHHPATALTRSWRPRRAPAPRWERRRPRARSWRRRAD
eukprot:4401955-Prymnesium_polylepis.1